MSHIAAVNTTDRFAFETTFFLPPQEFYRRYYTLFPEKSEALQQASLPVPNTVRDIEIFQTFLTDFSDFLITQKLIKNTMRAWSRHVLKLLKDLCLRLNFQTQHLQDKLDALKQEKTTLRSDLASALSTIARTLINNAYAACTQDQEITQKKFDLVSAKAAITIRQVELLEKCLKDISQPAPHFLLKLAEEAKYHLSTSLALQR